MQKTIFPTHFNTSASSRWPWFHMISIACRFYSIAAFPWVLFPLNSNFISSLCLSTGTMTSSQLGNLNGAFNLSHFCHVSILFLLIFILFYFISLFEAHNKRNEETRPFVHAFVDSRSLYGSHPCIVKFQGRLVERQRQRPSQNAEINFFPIFFKRIHDHRRKSRCKPADDATKWMGLRFIQNSLINYREDLIRFRLKLDMVIRTARLIMFAQSWMSARRG